MKENTFTYMYIHKVIYNMHARGIAPLGQGDLERCDYLFIHIHMTYVCMQ
jgi:hypothetical protein